MDRILFIDNTKIFKKWASKTYEYKINTIRENPKFVFVDIDGVSVKSIQISRKFDCSKRTTKVILSKGFIENMGLGELLFEKKGELEWERVDKSTFLEYAMRIACRI